MNTMNEWSVFLGWNTSREFSRVMEKPSSWIGELHRPETLRLSCHTHTFLSSPHTFSTYAIYQGHDLFRAFFLLWHLISFSWNMFTLKYIYIFVFMENGWTCVNFEQPIRWVRGWIFPERSLSLFEMYSLKNEPLPAQKVANTKGSLVGYNSRQNTSSTYYKSKHFNELKSLNFW